MLLSKNFNKHDNEMPTKPVIAITLDRHTNNDGFCYSMHPWYALRCDYSDIVASLGAIPIFISYEHNLIDDVLSMVDGLIISGGDHHIPSSFYGEKSSCKNPGEIRAKYEIALFNKALKLNMPILGICNGMQVMNVALGGTLVREIENHRQPHPTNIPYHSIKIVEKTKLFEIGNKKHKYDVNSTHKQGVGTLGANLIISSTAEDGIIESIESTKHDFVIGVEWHPEYNNSLLDENLFKTLIKKARKDPFSSPLI